jgi:hypothetical protein
VVPPGEAGANRVEAAHGTRFSGETTRSASLLRKQIMNPPSEGEVYNCSGLHSTKYRRTAHGLTKANVTVQMP